MSTRIAPHLRLGRRGERLAVRYLHEHGLRLVARNWRCPAGELDLVLTTDHAGLVFCEVKTRSSTAYGLPSDAVTPDKAARIRRLAHAWQTAHHVPPHPDRQVRPRFDLVSILWLPNQLPAINHIPGAF
ncbi:MAG: YraN family protein [Labedaea sp.]